MVKFSIRLQMVKFSGVVRYNIWMLLSKVVPLILSVCVLLLCYVVMSWWASRAVARLKPGMKCSRVSSEGCVWVQGGGDCPRRQDMNVLYESQTGKDNQDNHRLYELKEVIIVNKPDHIMLSSENPHTSLDTVTETSNFTKPPSVRNQSPWSKRYERLPRARDQQSSRSEVL